MIAILAGQGQVSKADQVCQVNKAGEASAQRLRECPARRTTALTLTCTVGLAGRPSWTRWSCSCSGSRQQQEQRMELQQRQHERQQAGLQMQRLKQIVMGLANAHAAQAPDGAFSSPHLSTWTTLLGEYNMSEVSKVPE